MQSLPSYALFAVPVLAVVLLSTCQVGGPQAQDASKGARSGAPSEASPSDSLVLENRTGDALVYKAFNPRTARVLPAQIEVDLESPPAEYVAAGGTAALWPCDALDAYVNYTLHLYRVAVPDGDSTTVTAPLAKSVRASSARLAEWKQSDCRLEISAW